MFKQLMGILHTLSLFSFSVVCVYASSAWAVCTNTSPGSNDSVTCSGAQSNVLVNAQVGSSNVKLTVEQGASMTGAHTTPVPMAILSVQAFSVIENFGSLGLTNSVGTGTNRGAAILAHGNGNQLFNRQGASIINSGSFNDGMAADGSNNILRNEGYIETGGPNAYGMSAAWGQANSGMSGNEMVNIGVITTKGSSARGMSILGGSAHVLNQGTVTTSGSSSTAIYMQGDNNQLVNSGRVEAFGASSDAVFSNTVTSTFTARIENQFGGEIISHQAAGVRSLNGATTVINAGLIRGATNAIQFGNGNDTLILQTGSVIDGIADGASGKNIMFLQGSGAATNPFVNFQDMTMEGDHWVWQGSGSFDKISLTTGNFQLSSTIAGTNGTVSTGATLSGDGVFVGSLSSQGTLQPGTGQAAGQLTIQGNYHGDQGLLLINSVLGFDDSPTNRLVIDGGVADGMTTIQVTNLNGQGAETVSNGILLVQAINGASTDPSAFQLSGRLVAGAYEYDLYRSGFDGATSENNWYLRSASTPVIGGGGGISPELPSMKPAVRPEAGVYLRNLTVTSTMFVHSLRERLGDVQYALGEKNEKNTASLWLRVVGRHINSRGGQGQINLDTDTTLVHLGGDLIGWHNERNRFQAGLMGAYGRNEVHASAKQLYTNNGIKRTATGTVNGYGVGVYATWFGDQDKVTGPYVDFWGMYGRYTNKVKGNLLKEEKYDSKGWTFSVEGGYAFVVHENEKRQWMIEPQAQLVYNKYKMDNLVEANGTSVDSSDANSWISRLGLRVSSRNTLNRHGVLPFAEINWWHSNAKNSLDFSGKKLADGTPNSRYELKVGLQGELVKGLQIWGTIGGKWGKDGYHGYEGTISIKKLF